MDARTMWMVNNRGFAFGLLLGPALLPLGIREYYKLKLNIRFRWPKSCLLYGFVA